MLLKPRPETVNEFAHWLRDAIRAMEDIEAGERDLGDYDYAARLVRLADRHARYVGAQILCERCQATFRLEPDDAQLLSPEDGLTILGECLAWCVDHGAPSSDGPPEAAELSFDRSQQFPNGKPFLTETEATEWLGLKTTTLRDARLKRELLGGKMGRTSVYTMKNLLDWYETTKAKGN